MLHGREMSVTRGSFIARRRDFNRHGSGIPGTTGGISFG